MTKRIWSVLGIISFFILLSLAFTNNLFLPARAYERPSDWEQRVLGMSRPSNLSQEQFRRTQLYSRLQAKAAKDKNPYLWLLGSPLFERIPAATQNYFLKRYDLLPRENRSPAKEDLLTTSMATQDALGENIKINDSRQDTPPTVQNQTASASFNNTIVVVYNHIGDFLTRTSSSTDGGTTWQETIVSSIPRGSNLGDGVVAVDAAGTFYVSTPALSVFNDSTIAVSKSIDGISWMQAADATTVEVKARNFHIRPWIAADSTTSKFRGSVYVSWTKLDNIDSRSTIMFSRSTDGGIKFGTPVQITPDAKGYNVDGSRLAIGPAGEIYVTWFDPSTNSINIARSTDGGATFSKPVTAVALGNQLTPDLINGHFATNSFPSIAVDQSSNGRGRIYITFNARSGISPGDKSDVFLISSSNGGQTWGAPVRVNDDETETDQWMPSVTVTSSGSVALLWYDRRNDIANNALVDVYMASSTDGGQSFRTNIRVSNSNWMVVPTPTTLSFGYHGEYNQISARGDIINLNWGDDRNGTDPNVFYSSLPVDAKTTEDFILSARNLAVEMRAGTQALLQIDSNRINGFFDPIQLSAESPLPNAQFEFLPDNTIRPENSFKLRVTVPDSTLVGNYPVTITGRSGAKVRSTTIEVVVIGSNPLTKPRDRITNTPGDSSNPKLVTDARGVVHMVWQDDTDGVPQIFYARSTNGGAFSEPVDISGSPDPNLRPQIGLDTAGAVHIVWELRQGTRSSLVYVRSDDGGFTFSGKRIVSIGIDIAFDVAMAVGQNGTVNFVCSGKTKASDIITSVFLIRSLDRGNTFLAPTVVQSSLGTQQAFFEPTIGVDAAGIIHIASALMIVQVRNFNVPTFSASIFYTRSVDGGLSFTEPLNIGKEFLFTDSPTLITSPGSILLLFAGFDSSQPFPSREIYLARSFDNGVSFSLNQLLVGNGDSSHVAASLDPTGNLFVVWRDTQTRNSDIFLSRFFLSEQAFNGTINISQNFGISENPTVSNDQRGNAVIAWEDETAGNNEIFFTRLTDADLLTPAITSISPLQGPGGQVVEVRGRNFVNIVDVRIGRFSVKVDNLTPTMLSFTVPPGITSGPILILTRTGLVRSDQDFLVTGKIAATPTRIDFGPVNLDETATMTVKVINATSSVRKILGTGSDNPAFTLGQVTLPITLQPNQTFDLPLIFKPRGLAFQTARIVIGSDDQSPSPLTITVTGFGTDNKPPVVGIETSPAEGEKLHAGDKVTITWKVTDNSPLGRQEIQLSLDDGLTFPIVLASGLRSERLFDFIVPKVNAKKARFKIIASDIAGNRGEATSVSFRIKKR